MMKNARLTQGQTGHSISINVGRSRQLLQADSDETTVQPISDRYIVTLPTVLPTPIFRSWELVPLMAFSEHARVSRERYVCNHSPAREKAHEDSPAQLSSKGITGAGRVDTRNDAEPV